MGRRDQAQVLYEQCLQLLDRRAFKAQEIHVEELAFKAAHPDGYVEIIPQRLFNFALELMGASSGTPRLDWEEDFTLPPDADYIALARLVTTDDPDAAARAVCRLCDLHVTYSRPFGPDNEDALTGFEFDDPFLALWPVEVFAWLHVRASLGLAVPEVDHPLLDQPLGRWSGVTGPAPVIEDWMADLIQQVATLDARYADLQRLLP
ncbi:MAG: hypothetical protein AAFY65_04290 [Pseudomonadota bacterium]